MKKVKDFAVGSLEYWKNQWLGKVFEMEDGDFVKVVEYRKSRSITVEFLKTGFTLNTRTDRILEGKLKDRLNISDEQEKDIITELDASTIKKIADFGDNIDGESINEQ